MNTLSIITSECDLPYIITANPSVFIIDIDGSLQLHLQEEKKMVLPYLSPSVNAVTAALDGDKNLFDLHYKKELIEKFNSVLSNNMTLFMSIIKKLSECDVIIYMPYSSIYGFAASDDMYNVLCNFGISPNYRDKHFMITDNNIHYYLSPQVSLFDLT